MKIVLEFGKSGVLSAHLVNFEHSSVPVTKCYKTDRMGLPSADG